MFDGEAFGQQMVEIVRGYVSAELAPLVERNAQLESRLAAVEGRELVLPERGEPGLPGTDGKDGVDGVNGTDGAGMADALIDNEGNLVLTMTDGRTKTLGRVVGRDGADGENGAPGETFTLDDFDIEQIDERAFKFGFTKGEVRHAFEFSFPVVLDRGVWATAKTYEKGDAVSWAGALWIAQKDAPGKPDTAESGWRLAVKKGRDGKGAA